MPPGRIPLPAPKPEEADRARQDRRRRAKEESLEVRPRFDRPYPSFEVRNPVHGTHYLVLAPGDPREQLLLCPCPDFGRRDVGTCKHVEAVRPWLGHHDDAAPEPPTQAPEPVWAAMEAGTESLPASPWTDLRSVEALGRRILISKED